MRVGVVFPQTEIGPDPDGVRRYAEAVEAAGYRHLVVFDHVLGANPERPGGWRGPYTHRSQFHEPFVLFGFLAAVTRRLELVTEILILPQRQTALVAKQAAEADVLSGGRLRIGVGLGWNTVEYEALGMDFTNRGRRVEEQIEVLRRLWTEELVTFRGRWHSISDAGLNPLPVQRPIPVWMGGSADAALRRAARVADGWMTNDAIDSAELEHRLGLLRSEVRGAERDVAAFGVGGRVHYRGDAAPVVEAMHGWDTVAATHVCVNTMGAGLSGADAHIEAAERVMAAWRLEGGTDLE